MYSKYKLFVFDFDGTLTRRDTFIEFLRYVHGTKATLKGLLRCSPQLLLMTLGLADNGKVKERVFARFFAGMNAETFDTWCRRFARDNKSMLRPKGMKRLREVLDDGSHALIVSASITQYVAYFFDDIVADYPIASFRVVGTEVSLEQGRVSGRFATPNCYGAEKLRRVRALYPARDDYYLTVYGDSRGDLQLLDDCDEGYYRPFRGKISTL